LQEVIRLNRRALTAPIQQDLIVPLMHVNWSKGGFYSVFDRVHYLDPKFRPVVVVSDVAPKGKLKQSYKPI